ncbi:Uncharacterised protein [Escherichia coli]|nr:Uncharacterised protein [Escherichia coli]
MAVVPEPEPAPGKDLISANLRVEPSEECDASVPR